ncbi:MAG: DUF5666 domain-containing protein [Burkholderiales bacterium]
MLALASCGGGTGGTGSGGSSPAVSQGVMQKGSTIVNGVRFEDTTANIFIDDTPKTAAALQNGMVVKVLGTVNDDGINGTAQRVKALIEVRGAVTAVFPAENPQRLVVLNQDVIVDDLTVYSNLANFAAIAVSALVEVHGLRDTTGRIRATRIEANQAQMGDDTVDEIRGVVSGGAGGSNPTTFNLGLQAVDASGAVIAPAGASYQNGSVVEVHCNVRPCLNVGVFQASRIVVESAEDSAFQPGSGQRFEAEGLISGFAGHPGDFSVAGTPVTTTASTRFEGGIATDLADNIKVEAEGSWNGTRLVASKIEFKRSVIRLQGATANGAGQTFDLQIANNNYAVKIELDSLTSGSLPVDGLACVQVRGQRKIGAPTLTVTAGEIGTCSNSDRHFIQAPVEVEVPENTITLLGFSLDVSNPTDTPNQWVDINDLPITRTAFFNAVTAATTNAAGSVPGTLVKVIFDTPGTTVRQAEIED